MPKEKKEKLHYKHEAGQEYVKQLGMFWDAEFAARADSLAHKHRMTQKAWDEMVREYAWRVKCMFDPKSYPWLVRIALAFRFLNPFN